MDDAVAFAVVPLPSDGVIGTAVALVAALVVLYLLARGSPREFGPPGRAKKGGSRPFCPPNDKLHETDLGVDLQ